MEMIVHRIGVAQHKELKFAVLFHRGIVKRSTKYRLFRPDMGQQCFAELDPSEWREKYKIVQEYKASETGQPT